MEKVAGKRLLLLFATASEISQEAKKFIRHLTGMVKITCHTWCKWVLCGFTFLSWQSDYLQALPQGHLHH
ncbi:hypothetical protein A4R26_04440 [Niastella populi]|uniref:Uncharacterized protein n=2 Tax=Niastella populi TaxID=550983 RepID=A0A1V9FDZ0_9BACT|nr:hypothetical protein A4R26_04440 [Niastella populi]